MSQVVPELTHLFENGVVPSVSVTAQEAEDLGTKDMRIRYVNC